MKHFERIANWSEMITVDKEKPNKTTVKNVQKKSIRLKQQM